MTTNVSKHFAKNNEDVTILGPDSPVRHQENTKNTTKRHNSETCSYEKEGDPERQKSNLEHQATQGFKRKWRKQGYLK